MADTPQTNGQDEALHDAKFLAKRYLSPDGIVKQVVHTWPLDNQGEILYSESGNAPSPPESLDNLDFKPQSMVGWFRPSELVKAGIEAVVSAVFGSYADKREVESVLTGQEWHDYSKNVLDTDELWIDYIADLGDGWDATYTMARLLAEKELFFDTKTKQAIRLASDDPRRNDPTTYIPTQRGRILVMGGDEVYPTANREEYTNRTVEPYRSALPFVEYAKQAPHLYLIPGNHDWYDGLNSFFKIFCQENWIGGWKTWQKRSYFALRLVAHDEATGRPALWLWGIDIQLSSNIDRPQLNYFNHVASEVMAEGSKIILCTAEPSWVYVDAKTKEETNPMKREKRKEEIYHNLGHLEKKAINRYKHEVIVGLAGDWHNYTRYEGNGAPNQQRFVSGGGGAYLYPTHNMPQTLTLPKRFGGTEYARKAVFPSDKNSKRLANWSLLFSFFRLNWGFTVFLGAFYLLMSWIAQSVSKVTVGQSGDPTLLGTFMNTWYLEWNDIGAFIEVIAHSPGSVVFLSILVAGLIAFSGYESVFKKIIHGGLHGLAHAFLLLYLFSFFAWLNLNALSGLFADVVAFLQGFIPWVSTGWGVDHALQVVLFGVEMLVFGGTIGGIIFGFYLWFSNRFLKIHDNEVLLCQSDPDYKNFLRFHIKKDGSITIYPIGVERVNRKRSWSLDKTKRRLAAWALQSNAAPGKAWFEPKEGTIQDFAQLIEDPIPVSFGDAQPAQSAPQPADATA